MTFRLCGFRGDWALCVTTFLPTFTSLHVVIRHPMFGCLDLPTSRFACDCLNCNSDIDQCFWVRVVSSRFRSVERGKILMMPRHLMPYPLRKTTSKRYPSRSWSTRRRRLSSAAGPRRAKGSPRKPSKGHGDSRSCESP